MLLPLIGGEDNRDQTYDVCISIEVVFATTHYLPVFLHICIMNGLNNARYLGQNKMGSRMAFRNENNASMQVIEHSRTLYK